MDIHQMKLDVDASFERFAKLEKELYSLASDFESNELRARVREAFNEYHEKLDALWLAYDKLDEEDVQNELETWR